MNPEIARTLVVILFPIFFFIGYLKLRNVRVALYRNNMMLRMNKCRYYDHCRGKDSIWRLEEFHKAAGHDEMLWKFWRPLNSFYREVPFLEQFPPATSIYHAMADIEESLKSK